MKRLFFLAASFFLMLSAFQLQAQSLRNTNWKMFVGDPINDSITLHIHSDSSVVTNSAGTALVRSLCALSGDTLTLKDYDGPYACQNMDGIYKIRINDGYLTLSMINDPCDGRVHTIDGVKWIRSW